MLTLAWTEAGGPAVARPTRRGFGTTLIERALTYDLDAYVRREFPAAGVRCTVVLPLNEKVGHARSAGDAGGKG